MTARVRAIVDAAIANKIYVIVDWHILSDNDPNANKEAAKTFFQYMSTEYKNSPNVLYEICNEPNGGTDWPMITAYANYIIPRNCLAPSKAATDFSDFTNSYAYGMRVSRRTK